MTDAGLVTEGAGYIGSHVALASLDEGYSVVMLDDLSEKITAVCSKVLSRRYRG